MGIYKILDKKFVGKSRFFPKLIATGKYKNLYWILEKAEKGKLGGLMDSDLRFLKKLFIPHLENTPRSVFGWAEYLR